MERVHIDLISMGFVDRLKPSDYFTYRQV